MKNELKKELLQELVKGNVKIGQLIVEVCGNNYYYENKDKGEKMKVTDEQISKATKVSHP